MALSPSKNVRYWQPRYETALSACLLPFTLHEQAKGSKRRRLGNSMRAEASESHLAPSYAFKVYESSITLRTSCLTGQSTPKKGLFSAEFKFSAAASNTSLSTASTGMCSTSPAADF